MDRIHLSAPTLARQTSSGARRGRRGVALVSVLFAIAVVSTLLAGVFWVTTQEQRLGENARRQRQSFGAAQVGVGEILRTWDSKVRNNLAIYPKDSVVIALTATPSGSGRYSAKITRLGMDVFLVDVTGSDNVSTQSPEGTGSRQRIGMLVRTVPDVTMKPRGAFAGTGKVKVKDAITVDGNDHIPAGWTDCPPLETAIVGFNTDASSKVKFMSPAVALGNPPTAETITPADTAAMSATFDSLLKEATITLNGGGNVGKVEPTITNGACDTSLDLNWGSPLDPTGPCGAYFPVIRINGHVNIHQGIQGQGILMVDGDVYIKGGFTWVGIILAEGKIKLTGDGSGDPNVTGMIVSRKKSKFSAAAEDTIEGNSKVLYSRCAIMQAMRTARSTQMMRSRSWAQLF